MLELGGAQDEAIGGLLHDVVEDGGGPAALARIRGRWGPTPSRRAALIPAPRAEPALDELRRTVDAIDAHAASLAAR